MQSYIESLKAADGGKTFPIAGKVIYIKSSTAGEVVSIELIRRNAQSDKVENVGKGFKGMPVNAFDGVRLTVSADSTVEFIVTDGDIDLKFDFDARIIGNTDAEPVPVKTPAGQPLEVNFAGVVNPVFGELTNDDAHAVPVQPQSASVWSTEEKLSTGQAEVAPVPVTDVATALLAADATRRGVRFRNAGANAVALVPAAGTYANATDIIQPGETWNENEAPGVAWYAICDVGLASTINIKTIS